MVTAGTDYLEGSGAFTLSSTSVIRETVDLKLPVTFTVKSGTTDTISTASFTGIDAPTYDSVSKTYTINLAAGTYSVQASTGTYTAQTKDFTLVDEASWIIPTSDQRGLHHCQKAGGISSPAWASQ